MQSEKKILIAGAGSFGRECENWLAMYGTTVLHFLDDEKPGCMRIDEYEPQDDEEVLLAISDPQGKRGVHTRLMQRGAKFHSIRLCYKGPYITRIGGGGIYLHGTVISRDAEMGDFVHVNLNSTIGHDTKIGDYSTISCHCDVMGHAELGRRVFMGSGSRVLPHVKVGDDAKIGAGAVVVKDVPAGATVLGPHGIILV